MFSLNISPFIIYYWPMFAVPLFVITFIYCSIIMYITLYIGKLYKKIDGGGRLLLEAGLIGAGAHFMGAYMIMFTRISSSELIQTVLYFVVAGLLIGYLNYNRCLEVMNSREAIRIAMITGILSAPWIYFLL